MLVIVIDKTYHPLNFLNLIRRKKTTRGAGQQIHKQNWILVFVNENEIELESYALNENNEVISFYEENR